MSASWLLSDAADCLQQDIAPSPDGYQEPVVLIIGNSDSGKTTFCNFLAGYSDSDSERFGAGASPEIRVGNCPSPSLKLSNIEPGQYLDGRPPGNTGCY